MTDKVTVTINGEEYAPVSSLVQQKPEPKIGIAITTHNRNSLLKTSFAQMQEYLPPGAVVVIVDDGSDTPIAVADGIRLIRNDEPHGIAAAKNQCIDALMSAGCDHLFLFDDDTFPKAADWHQAYIENHEPHLMYCFDGKVSGTAPGTTGYTRPNGCMLYVTAEVVRAVGGMDESFGRWGFEHENWSDRIHNNGFTTFRYQDIDDGGFYIHCRDQEKSTQPSVSEEIRKQSNPEMAEAKRYSREFIDYRQREETKAGILLSILVPSVSQRFDTTAHGIQAEIYGQIDCLGEELRDRVEVIFLADNRKINLGKKRNMMVGMASGEYVAFVDDDDRLSDNYVQQIMTACLKGPDCVTFLAKVSINGAASKLCRYSLAYSRDENLANEYHRVPNHLCAVRRTLALRTPFPEKNCGEDAAYAADLRPLLKSEKHIDAVMYHYDYSDDNTATQGKQRAIKAIIKAARKPLVDVVILAAGKTPELIAMTQKAIDTCIGNTELPVNVIVVEGVAGVRYRRATTVHRLGDFHYNKACNFGASFGVAEWVMFANNDLLFHAGWLEELMKWPYAVKSPSCPRLRHHKSNPPAAYVNGNDFCGWCFMMKRDIFDRIGGLDEDFSYWCADDSVIEQLKAIGESPRRIMSSKVEHLVSATGGKQPDDSMTWEQVHNFEQKYGVKKFDNDARYADWKRRNLL